MFFKISSKLSIVQILSAIFALVFTFLAARILDPESFGVLRYLLVLLPFFLLASLPTYDNLILREASSGSLINLNEILKIRAIFALIGSIFFGIFFLLFQDRFATETIQGVILILLLLPLYETTTSYRNYLIGLGLKHQALRIQIRNKSLSVLILLIGIIFLFYFNFSTVNLLLVFMIATTLPNIFTHFYLVTRKRLLKFKKVKLVKEALSTSLATGVWIVSYSLDRLIIEREMGNEALAYYSIIVLAPYMISQLIDGLIPFWYKKIFFNKFIFFTFKNLILFSLVFTIIILAYGFFAHLFYPFIFGDFYSYSLALSLLSGLLILTGSVEFLFIHYLYKEKKTFEMLIYNLSSIAVLFISFSLFSNSLNYFLIMFVICFKQIFLPLIYFLYEKFFYLNFSNKEI